MIGRPKIGKVITKNKEEKPWRQELQSSSEDIDVQNLELGPEPSDSECNDLSISRE